MRRKNSIRCWNASWSEDEDPPRPPFESPLEEVLVDGRPLLAEVETVTLGMIDCKESCIRDAFVFTSGRTMTERRASLEA